MKKRLITFLLLAAVLLTALPGARAATALCFVAINDSVPLTLADGSAPYYSGGRLYLPYTAFNASPNGVGASYNAEKNTFVLFNKDQMLLFDLKGGTYTDNRNQQYSVSVAYRGGVLYVPASVASHFGLSVTLLTSRAGYSIIRFTNGSQVYDDGMFVAQAENLITHMAAQYAQGGNGQPSGNGNDTNGSDEEDKPVQVYLAFAGDSVSENTRKLLKDYGISAAFFLTEEQLQGQKELARNIYADGHTIGLTVSPDETDWLDGLNRCNDAMDEALFCRTPVALLPVGTGLQTDHFRVFAEPQQTRAIASVLSETERTHLYVVRENAAAVVDAFLQGGAALVQLLETSRIS